MIFLLSTRFTSGLRATTAIRPMSGARSTRFYARFRFPNDRNVGVGCTRAHFRLLLRNVIVRRELDSVVVRNRVVVAFRAIRRLDRVRVRRYARMLFEGRSILPGYASVRDFEVRVSYCMSYRRRRNVVRSIR